MKVTLDIQDSKAAVFLNFIKSLDFIKVEEERNSLESPYDPEFVTKIKQSEKEFEEGNSTTVEKKDLQNLLGL